MCRKADEKLDTVIFCAMLVLFLLLTGCGQIDDESSFAENDVSEHSSWPETAEESESDALEDTMNEIIYTTQKGETGYLYVPLSVLEHPEKRCRWF